MKKAATILLAGALAALGLAACGGSSTSSTSSGTNSGTTAAQGTTSSAAAGAGGTIKISAAASGALMFNQKSLNTKAGTVTVDFNNPAPLMHDVVLSDSSGAQVGRTNLISQSTASFSAVLKPGTYTFLCDVPGHAQAGMKGTITVK